MEFLGNLGVDFGLLIAQVVNFVFLMWLLSKLVYKPLMKRIEADEESIMKIVQANKELLEKEEQLEQRVNTDTANTKNRAKVIIAEAEEIAQTIKESALTEARIEKKAVIAQINQRLAEVSYDN